MEPFLTCFQVGRRLGWSTDKVKRAARAGSLPGAVFRPAAHGMHIMFDPAKLEGFIAAGGFGPVSPVVISHANGARSHASRNQNGVGPDGNAKRRRARELKPETVPPARFKITTKAPKFRTWRGDRWVDAGPSDPKTHVGFAR